MNILFSDDNISFTRRGVYDIFYIWRAMRVYRFGVHNTILCACIFLFLREYLNGKLLCQFQNLELCSLYGSYIRYNKEVHFFVKFFIFFFHSLNYYTRVES